MPTSLLSSLAARYRKRYPDLKFRIVRKHLKGEFALTHFDQNKGCFIVEIDKSLSPEVACFILAHETGHFLSWWTTTPEDHHGEAFWAAYRTTYRIYEEWVESLV
jgi:Zn-dependent peptidase ImmA (M78 family)